MERITRKEFFRESGKLALAVSSLATLAPAPRLIPRKQYSPPPKEILVAEISGIHETPTGDGSLNLDLAFDHFDRWDIKHTTIINPTMRWLNKAKETNINFIARLDDDTHKNRFHEQTFARFASSLRERSSAIVIIQLFNEINNRDETNGQLWLPEAHTRIDLIPGGEATMSKNFVPGITPFDQTQNGLLYYRRTLEEMKLRKGAKWVLNNWVTIAHNYTFSPGEYIWKNLLVMDDIAADVLGGHLMIYVTEAGPHYSIYRKYGESIYVNETVRTLRSPIPRWPRDLTSIIKSYDFWVYANGAQREKERLPKIGPQGEKMENFEYAAYIGLDENGQVYEKPVAIAAAEIKSQLAA